MTCLFKLFLVYTKSDYDLCMHIIWKNFPSLISDDVLPQCQCNYVIGNKDNVISDTDILSTVHFGSQACEGKVSATLSIWTESTIIFCVSSESENSSKFSSDSMHQANG